MTYDARYCHDVIAMTSWALVFVIAMTFVWSFSFKIEKTGMSRREVRVWRGVRGAAPPLHTLLSECVRDGVGYGGKGGRMSG